MLAIGRLEPVNVRELWKHEEKDFSAWLAQESNLKDLADTLGVRLSEPQRELLAGNFQCDLVAEDDNGSRVIIENQLEVTDHDHLGKLLTYLTNLDANTAIWITTNPRLEHVRTIQWLNETTPDNIAFYLVRLAAYRISGHHAAAPLFTTIVGPSIETKYFGKQKKELAERHVLRQKFWSELIERAKAKGVLLHAQIMPSIDNWISASAGVRAGVSFTYVIYKQKDESAVELDIDSSEPDENKQMFDSLLSKKAQIEQAFGAPLSWERLDEQRGSRVRFILQGGLNDEAKWPEIQDKMITAMDKFAIALKSHLQSTPSLTKGKNGSSINQLSNSSLNDADPLPAG